MEEIIQSNSKPLIFNKIRDGGGNTISTIPSRSFGLDLTRVFAIFAVIGGHFFSIHTDFRSSPMDDMSMFIQSMAQSILNCGVPLFIVLTGYLNINKIISRKYYSGIWRVLLAYLIFSIVTLIFRHTAMGESITLVSGIKSILNFSSFMYAWYIEMWIGLFLLIPFLNILYKGIGNKRHKQLLISTLAVMTFLPIFTNRYDQHILPAFWTSIYPLSFYYIGSYIREYRPEINKWFGLGIILAIGALPGFFTMLAAPGHSQIHILGDCFGIFGAIEAVLIFIILYDLNYQNYVVSRIIYWISLLSLDMYLCCYIFDVIVYPWFKDRYFVDQSSFGIYFFIIVPIVMLGAFTLSLIKRMFFSLPLISRFR